MPNIEPRTLIVDRPLDPQAAQKVSVPGVGAVVTRHCDVEAVIREADNVATVRKRSLHIFIVHESLVEDIPGTQKWEDDIYRLAHKTRAEVVRFDRSSLEERLRKYCRELDVRLLVIQGPAKGRRHFLQRMSLGERISGWSGCPPVFILRAQADVELKPPKQRSDWIGMAIVVGLSVSASFLLRPLIPENIELLLYILAVTVVSSFSRPLVSVVGSVIAAGSYTVFSYQASDPFIFNQSSILVLLSLGAVSLIISTLSWQSRTNLEKTKAQERQTAAFFSLTSDLLEVRSGVDVAALVESHLRDILDVEVAVFVLEGNEIVTYRPASIDFNNADHDRAALDAALNQGLEAGLGAQVAPLAFGLYLPVQGKAGLKGCLAVYPAEARNVFPASQLRVLDTFSSLVGVALERLRFDQEQRRAEQRLQETSLQNTMLRSVSHDLKTPLTSMTGYANQLVENPDQPVDVRVETYRTIRDQSWRLTNLINNLLSITKLESGALDLSLEHMFVEELVGTAVGQVRERTPDLQIKIDVSDDVMDVQVDAMIFNQALVNLIENAYKHTPEGTKVTVRARNDGDEHVKISVLDDGPGIPEDSFETIFNKFVRFDSGRKVEGTGLGLAIVKAIVELHGGNVRAYNRKAGGASFTMTLPAVHTPVPPESI